MQVQVRHQPSFAVARLLLAPGESVRAESGAMVAHTYGVQVQAQMQGGLKGALKRSVLGGESLFTTTFTAHPEHAGWVDVAATMPGDLHVVDVAPGHGLMVTRGSWLASGPDVTIDTRFGGTRTMFGGEGAFIMHASGQGPVVVSCYGALDTHELGEGQGFTCDSGHAVAWSEGAGVDVRRAATGMVQTMKSGEGLVMDFRGPGTVWTQSRNPAALVSWLTQALPFSRG